VSTPRFDVAVIGGGVVGCAVLRRLAMAGLGAVLLEKAPDILDGASKANSALLHTGFDAPPDSLELAMVQAGYREYRHIHAGMNLPLLETGAMVAAWNDDQADRLDAIAVQAHANGVDDVRRIERAEALVREPHLAPTLRAALLVPGEHVIDPWSAPLAYVTQAMAMGAQVWRKAALNGGTFDGTRWRLDTAQGPVEAGQVVNCAGLFGDHVERACLGDATFAIRPRKGQFVVFDKPAARFLTTTILPVPTDRTKGVVLCRTIWGNVLVGPTAEEQDDRDIAAVDHDSLHDLTARARTMLPALAEVPVNAIYAGLRPATEQKHYRIRHDPVRHWLTLGGIRSTGLTSALGLAAHAAHLLGHGEAIAAPRVTMPNLAEHRPRDWQQPQHGGMVCHCELVTEREIAQAMASPLPPTTLSGLKRRTRAMMGRCQGFHCGARLRQILAEAHHG
jgi:glycerol-3-phosphate dehydrogenase